MENLLQVPSDTIANEPRMPEDAESLGRLLAREAFSATERIPARDPFTGSEDLVKRAFLPDVSLESKNFDPKYDSVDPTAYHVKDLKALELQMQRGKSVEPEDLSKSLLEADKIWKVGPDEGIDSSAERKEYLRTLDNLFKRFDFKTQFALLNQMSDSKGDSSYKDRALEHLFANTAFEVGFDHKSMKNPGPQDREYGKAIVAIWSGLPEARQRRILEMMATKRF